MVKVHNAEGTTLFTVPIAQKRGMCYNKYAELCAFTGRRKESYFEKETHMKRCRPILALVLMATLLLGTFVFAPASAAAVKTDVSAMEKLYYYDFETTFSKDTPRNFSASSFVENGYYRINKNRATADLTYLIYMSEENVVADYLRIGSEPRLTFSFTIGLPATAEGETVNAFDATIRLRLFKDYTTNKVTADIPLILIEGNQLKNDAKSSLASLEPGKTVNLTVCVDRTYGGVHYYVDGVCLGDKARKRTDAALLNLTDYKYAIPLNMYADAKVTGTLLLDNLACYSGILAWNGDNSDYFEQVYPDMREDKFTDASMTLNEDINMNFFARLNHVTDTDKVEARFTSGGKTVTVSENREARRNVYNGYTEHMFSYTGIGPQNLTRTITCELLVNGEVRATKENYSAWEYCETLKAATTDETTLALIDALYGYADSAMLYVGTTDAEKTGYTGTAGTVPDVEGFRVTNGDNTRFISANVIFDYQNKLRIVFETAKDVTKEDYDVVVNETFLTAEDIHAMGNNRYYIEIDGVSALKFDKIFSVSVGDATLDYSINLYAYRMQNNARIGALARATYAYGVAAKAYAVAHTTAQ